MTTTDILPAPHPELLAESPPTRDDTHAAKVFLARQAMSNVRSVMRSLTLIADVLSGGRLDPETFPWHLIRYQHCAALRSWLTDRYKPSTGNKILKHLRGVLKEAWRLGQMDTDAWRRAVDFEGINGTSEGQSAGRMLSQGEVRALVAACDDTPMGFRDEACLAVLIGCGLRRGEVVALDMQDVDLDEGKLHVIGKRKKARTVFIRNGQAEALKAWIAVRGDWDGPVFLSGRRGGHIGTNRMSDQTLYSTLLKLAKRAGVKHLSPHDCRRTMISESLDAGADLFGLTLNVGHASVTTTQGYDRRGLRAAAKAAESVAFPWSGRVPA